MSLIEVMRERLGEFSECFDLGPYVAVPTQCLYPSRKAVTVYVTGGANECAVSDNGGAVDEVSIAGLSIPDTDGFLKHACQGYGIRIARGQIIVPHRPIAELPASIVSVANASRAAAAWGLKHLKAHRKRDLSTEISRVLAQYFGPERIRPKEGVTGASNRRYHVDYMVPVSEDRQLLIDGVLPEASSINAKAIAHLDIMRAAEGRFVSMLAYDDDDEWRSSDLSLLQMAGTLVPLSSMSRTVATYR